MLDRLPNKFIITSFAVHALAFGVLIYEGTFELKEVSLAESQTVSSVEFMIDSHVKEIKKELKKVLKQKVKTIDVGETKASQAELEEQVETQVVSLADLQKSSDLSPALKAFLLSLREQISRRKRYPYSAKRLRQTGEVVLNFDVFADGSIQNIKISKRSSYEKLNSSAYNLLAGISKVQNFPVEEVKSDKISITVPVEYKL